MAFDHSNSQPYSPHLPNQPPYPLTQSPYPPAQPSLSPYSPHPPPGASSSTLALVPPSQTPEPSYMTSYNTGYHNPQVCLSPRSQPYTNVLNPSPCLSRDHTTNPMMILSPLITMARPPPTTTKTTIALPTRETISSELRPPHCP